MTHVDLSSLPKFQKSQGQLQEILPFLRKNFLTKHLQEEEIEKIAQSMQPRKFNPKDTIIRYGDTGFEYFILSKG